MLPRNDLALVGKFGQHRLMTTLPTGPVDVRHAAQASALNQAERTQYPDVMSPGGGRLAGGKELLRQRAAAFRYAADQIDRLLGMTPAELSPEQEQALLFLGQHTQFAF